jgi:hypothetical protein
MPRSSTIPSVKAARGEEKNAVAALRSRNPLVRDRARRRLAHTRAYFNAHHSRTAVSA